MKADRPAAFIEDAIAICCACSVALARVGDRLLTAPRIFIDVGGRAVVPEMPGISGIPDLTNSTILKLDRIPRHLVIVGGSYIGLEFAQMYRRFGARVTIVEKGPPPFSGPAVTRRFMAFSTPSMPGCRTMCCSAPFPFIRRCRN